MQQTIWFKSDGLNIHGTLHLPDMPKPPIVVGAHGLMSDGDSPKQVALAEKLNEIGIAYFRFDHRGCGKSQGEFSEVTTFDGRCRDLLDGIKTLLDMDVTDGRIGLFGSSLGGAGILACASEINPRAVVTVAAPIRSGAIHPPYINDTANQPMLESLSRKKLFFDISNRVAGISNLLLFHGDADPIVPYENALEIYERASAPVELVRLENGDHPMSDEGHQAAFMARTIEWYRDKL
ncbi:MAG TPA: alpha/beta fold hydrolase [Desulfosalsimonadaceae bacterium]|nr:alpha/beta fold hydrolase [Desulfosalsimonadaceae bacterium]